ncbi:MAG TPA: ABC transporter substrate-binding protein [Burkholderiales bacterium]|nr:ABC transporter substrate-binding protein [Burkholderiales bacterium]
MSRRTFLRQTSALGAASLLGLPGESRAEPPPETTKIRLVKLPAICLAPQYLAEELLRLEGFSEVEYVEMDRSGGDEFLVQGRADVSVTSPPSMIPMIDAGKGLIALAGIHGGCYELFANERINAIRELKGKRVAVSAIPSIEYYYIASMLAYVGMDPRKDVVWVDAQSFDETMQYFIDGKVDAFLGFPPQPQKLRARKIGHVIVNTAQDRPWQQYFCCMIGARPEFVSRYPVATRRAVRAVLKATDWCAREPEAAARVMVAKGYEPSYDVALEVLKSLSYDRWRTYDIQDSLRFYALRLYEVGMITSTPQRIIDRGLDLRIVNELKKELKA